MSVPLLPLVFFPVFGPFLSFARGMGFPCAHLASVILTNTALGFGRLPIIADMFTAHHSLHSTLDWFPIRVPGKHSREDLHSHTETGSRVNNNSFSLWFAAIQPSSLQYLHGS